MSNDADREPDFFVGVGASAGGLEALKVLFKNTPREQGLAYIVVQHLSPDFQSIMDELLAKVTKLDIHYIEDGLRIQADTIYLNTPRTHVSIDDNVFRVSPISNAHKLDMPIDSFFRSLGGVKKDKSIAVILSGTGSDGSRGIHSVKEAGGLIIVQDPDDAKFDGMPKSSIDSGLVDIVLPVSEISSSISHYLSLPLVREPSKGLSHEDYSDEESLNDIFEILKGHKGINFALYKPTTIARRIERRMGLNQITSVREYYRFLLSSADELEILGKDLLIGVTSFFRDPEAFDVLRNEVIPEIVSSTKPDETIRAWVAGCSTGDEAYSIAICLDQVMHELKIHRPVKIFATDVNSDAVNAAGMGSYSLSIAEELGPDAISKYFEQEGDRFIVVPHIRRMVIFAVHNLAKDPPFSNIHLASCRNVLIYFQQNLQRQVLSSLQFSLVHRGFLFLGSSESLSEAQKAFAVIDERHRIFKKIDSMKVTMPLVPRDANGPKKISAPRAPSLGMLLKAHRGMGREASYKPVVDTLFSYYIPPSIVVDEDMHIVHIYGDVSDYTQRHRAGEFSSEITHIVIDELATIVSTAIQSVLEKKQSLMYENVVTGGEEAPRVINLRVTAVAPEHWDEQYVIVTFEDAAVKADSKVPISIVPFDPSTQDQERIRNLENQLKSNQEHLQVTIEELETTNEELQASNEELMAANEELQSTNEELQSVNEELYTVNNEYQEKIDEISQVNLDLDNLLKSSQIGIIFLDEALLIRHYTPAAEYSINLLPTDIGRPFHHISHKLRYPNLLDDISLTLADGKVRAKETMSGDNRDILVRITPYLGEKQQVSGCVISLTNISEINSLKESLSKTRQNLRQLIQAQHSLGKDEVSILILDDDVDDIYMIKNHLKKIPNTHFKLYSASSEDEARQILEDKNIEICLVDYLLGSENSLEFIQTCSSDIHRRCTFILVTGHISDEVDDKAKSIGIFSSIAKEDLSPSLLKHIVFAAIKAQVAVQMLQ